MCLAALKTFPTSIHKFAQPHRQIPIDAKTGQVYLPLQIEPRSFITSRLSFEGAAA